MTTQSGEKALTTFAFEGNKIETITDEAGIVWFKANAVCAVLGYGNPSQAIDSHVDSDDLQKLEVIDNLGRAQQANYLNESGLYALIFGSEKESAKKFKRWVTSEVLPQIRKTGKYEEKQKRLPVITIEYRQGGLNEAAEATHRMLIEGGNTFVYKGHLCYYTEGGHLDVHDAFTLNRDLHNIATFLVVGKNGRVYRDYAPIKMFRLMIKTVNNKRPNNYKELKAVDSKLLTLDWGLLDKPVI